MYKGRPQPHWVHRLLSSLRLFHVDHTGVPVDVVLCKHRHGQYGKGRAASALGLTHFVDNDMDCLWSCCRDPEGNCRATLERHGGRLIWFDVDSDVGQEELDRHLSQDLARFNRDRNAMEKWVSAAASWTRVAELIHPHVADAVQAGWDLFRDSGPPCSRAPEPGAALGMLGRLVSATPFVPRPPLRPPSRSVRAASDHSARAASAHSSRQAGSASHPQAGSASRPQAGPASQRSPRSASHSPPSPAGAPAAQVPSVAPDAPAEAPQPDAEAAVDWDPWEFPPLSPERVPGMPDGFPTRPPGMPAMLPRATAAEPMDR